MIVVTNRIPVAKGHEIDFEDRFRKPNGEFGSAAAGVWFAALASLLIVVVLATGYVRALGRRIARPKRSLSRRRTTTRQGI